MTLRATSIWKKARKLRRRLWSRAGGTAKISRTAQLKLNGRAVFRDLAAGHFTKLGFHLRGVFRALSPFGA